MLLVVVVIWALNFTVTKYVLVNGFQPIVFSALRYMAAAVVLGAVTLYREHSLRMERRDLILLLAAGLCGSFINQAAFPYAIKLSGVTTTALITGTVPVMTALAAAAFRVEAFSRRAALAGVISFGGVALVVAGSGNLLGGSVAGELLAILCAATWAVYTVALKPLARRYSPYRIYSIVLIEGAVLLPLAGLVQFSEQRWSLGALPWLAVAFSTVGPLILADLLWISSIRRVGPSRATLFSNLQPLIATGFAVVLLAEGVGWAQVGGGVLIGIALMIGRRRPPTPARRLRIGPTMRAVRGMARTRKNR